MLPLFAPFGSNFQLVISVEQLGLTQDDQGMKLVNLPSFDIPLIVRKSDGMKFVLSSFCAAMHNLIGAF